MKIHLLSDLHLEANPHARFEPVPGADLLVLAGDIGSYQANGRMQEPDFGLARFSPRHGWPTPVCYVPGNHEYDNADFDEVHARLRRCCDDFGIQWLEREVIHVGPVRLVGTTLWADFDALVEPGDDLGRALKKRGKAMRAADFYLNKALTTREGRPFLSPQLREQSLRCQAWLREALAPSHDGTTVVVTHFAPTLESADPRYGRVPGTAGFCNRLDDLLPLADVWMHGHLHHPVDYHHRGCRVVANPLGYAGKGEQQNFEPTKLIDVGPGAGPARSRADL